MNFLEYTKDTEILTESSAGSGREKAAQEADETMKEGA